MHSVIIANCTRLEGIGKKIFYIDLDRSELPAERIEHETRNSS